MPAGLKKIYQEKLAELGIEVETYHVDTWPPIWGLALKRNDEDVVVIETKGNNDAWDPNSNKYILRPRRSKPKRNGVQTNIAPTISIHNRQKDAIASWLRKEYQL